MTIKTAVKLALAVFLLCVLFVHRAGAQASVAAVHPGEVSKYIIKKFGVKVGDATLSFGEDKLGNTAVYVIVFTAKAPNFFDEERIYVDRQTFHPMVVKRDLNIFGKKEKITEIYDNAKAQIRIVKEAKGKTTEQTIERSGAVDNIYCFLYRFRMDGKVAQGQKFDMNLPTKIVELEVLGQDQVQVMGKNAAAIYLESDPRQYKLWFDMGPQRVPLRIDGAMGLASTSLVLAEYKP